MLFGIDYFHIFFFIVLVSLGESLISPKLYEYIFHFTKKGREGMFLALTSAPQYLTMAVSGYMSGILLTNYFPENGIKRPDYIWIFMMCSCGTSLILFLLCKNCFSTRRDHKE